jgi:murein DD-endopeptidase MepM/ murein hydrolase activator NlpD
MRILLLLFILNACSSMESGQYIQLNRKSSPQELAKLFKVDEDVIREKNHGLNYIKGSWIFIPKDIGLLYYDSGSEGKNQYASTGLFMWPVPKKQKISSYFGKRGRRYHYGIDIPGKKGTPIVAAAEGKVVYADNRLSGYGNMIIIKHKSGYKTIYAHNSSNHVDVGDKVQKGQVIASMGRTGRATGTHLHFEIRKNNRNINPYPYLKKSRQALAIR